MSCPRTRASRGPRRCRTTASRRKQSIGRRHRGHRSPIDPVGRAPTSRIWRWRIGHRRVALADRREVRQPVVARDVGEVVVGQPGAGDVEDVALGMPEISQMRAVLSLDALRTRLPSGENSALLTAPDVAVEHGDRLTRRGVPDARRVVVGSRDHACAIGRKCGACYHSI